MRGVEMKDKASLGKRKLLAVIVIMLFSVIIGYSPSVHAKGEGIETFGVNHDGYLEMNGEVLYMLVDGERVKATLNGLIEKGDANQQLLMESDLEDKQGMIASIFSFLKPSKAKALAPKIEYKGAVTYRGSVVGDFRVDGKQAFVFSILKCHRRRVQSIKKRHLMIMRECKGLCIMDGVVKKISLKIKIKVLSLHL